MTPSPERRITARGRRWPTTWRLSTHRGLDAPPIDPHLALSADLGEMRERERRHASLEPAVEPRARFVPGDDRRGDAGVRRLSRRLAHAPSLHIFRATRRSVGAPGADRDRRRRILRTAFDDLIGIDHVDEHVAPGVAASDDMHAFEEERTLLAEHLIALREFGGESDGSVLPAGERDVRSVLGEAERAADTPLLMLGLIADHAVDQRIVDPIGRELVVGGKQLEVGRLAEDQIRRFRQRRNGAQEHRQRAEAADSLAKGDGMKAHLGVLETGIRQMSSGSDATFPQLDAFNKAARLAFEGVCGLADEVLAEQKGRAVAAADEAAYRQAIAAESHALETFAMSPPRSLPGLLAALDYLRPSGDDALSLDHFIQTVVENAALLSEHTT